MIKITLNHKIMVMSKTKSLLYWEYKGKIFHICLNTKAFKEVERVEGLVIVHLIRLLLLNLTQINQNIN